MIYIFSPKKAAALERALAFDKKKTNVEILHHIPAKNLIAEDDQAYLDITALSPAELKKNLLSLRKSFGFWGIIDPKGEAPDPASYFFDGACDYIGPALIKKGLDKKRFAGAFSWALKSERFEITAEKTSEKSKTKETVKKEAPSAETKKGIKTKSANLRLTDERKDTKAADSKGKKNAVDTVVVPDKKRGLKFPAGKFEGWKSVRSGSTSYFLFLFITLSGKTNLPSMMGAAAFNALKKRLRDTGQQFLRDADALLWMETEESCIFLIPPRAVNSKAAVEAILKMIINSRLIALEKFHLPFPVEFTFALHYGKTIFQEPGKTGSIISEPVNYIFHLGGKKAETGRLTVSGDVPDDAIPEGFDDLFDSAGEYEGIPLRHSKRFVYKS